MSQKNLWPKKLQELLDVDPIWPADIKPGYALVVNTEKDGFSFSATAVKGEQGDKGDPGDDGNDGPPNELTIGTVTIGTPQEASVTIEGDSPNQVLNFVIPKGDEGSKGDNAINPNFLIGGVSVGTPAVSLTGTYPDLVLNYRLPPGTKGDTGDEGPSNNLTVGTVGVGPVAEVTITGESPNQQINFTLVPGPPGMAGAVQEISSSDGGLTVDNTDPAYPILTVNFPEPVAVIPQVDEVIADRDIIPSDENAYLRYTSASDVTLTVPLDLALVNASAEIYVRQAGTGAVTLAAAVGVTINAPFGGTLKLAGQGATVTLKKVGTNEYDLSGLVEAAP